MSKGALNDVSNVHGCAAMQAWQAESEIDSHNGRAWSAPNQPSSGQWGTQHAAYIQPSAADGHSHILAWPPVQRPEPAQQPQHAQQANAVPSAVQQRAAQYAGDEGLARPPTRPPSDWRPRQSQWQEDEGTATAIGQPPPNVDR